MTTRAVAVISAAFLLTVSAACAHRPSVPHDREVSHGRERERLQRREADFLAALGARDLEQTTASFAENAVLHVANMPPIQGGDAIRRFYTNVFRFLAESSSAPATLRLSASADMAYSLGTVTNVFAGDQGTSEHTGKYLLVWERRNDEWRITVYSISSDRPAE